MSGSEMTCEKAKEDTAKNKIKTQIDFLIIFSLSLPLHLQKPVILKAYFFKNLSGA